MILVGSGRTSMYKCTSTRILFPAKGNLVRKPLLQLLPHTFTGRAGCYVDWQQVLKCRMCSVYIFSFFKAIMFSLLFSGFEPTASWSPLSNGTTYLHSSASPSSSRSLQI